MSLDSYSSCPCGSGKKFKWCCQPIQSRIDKAVQQDRAGQHDAALKTLDEVIKENPGNPEGWGRKAQLLFMNNRVEEAENALNKAFELSPKFPFGYLLRGLFRQTEGEVPGALTLFRKAADAYDPECRDILSQIYTFIAECELKLDHPVAGKAALRVAAKLDPANEELRKHLQESFGDASPLPLSARQDYTFQSPGTASSASRREEWNHVLQGSDTNRLSEIANLFDRLVHEDEQDAAAWYNLGIVRAWLGDNRGALAALERNIALEKDEPKAVATGLLTEVLRFGREMLDETDHIDFSITYQLRDPNQAIGLLNSFEEQRRLVGVQVVEEDGIVSGLILEKVVSFTSDPESAPLPHLGAYFMIYPGHFRLWSTHEKSLSQIQQEIEKQAGSILSNPQRNRWVAPFVDIFCQALTFPVSIADKHEAKKRVIENYQKYFEERWIHQPLRSLQGTPPIDAAGHETLRKKLKAVIQFLQECSGINGTGYDFDSLRRKLGLLEADASALTEVISDIATLGTAELASLPINGLEEKQLETAFQTAIKLDARELAKRFAETLLARPAGSSQTDRFSYYLYLLQICLAEGNTDVAMNLINEGEKADCESNEGRRRNDYELRRGQVHAKRGEIAEARTVFEKLIERSPTELRIRGTAAESMLSAGDSANALAFAESALIKARERNDRDSEEYFQELVRAAQKKTGS